MQCHKILHYTNLCVYCMSVYMHASVGNIYKCFLLLSTKSKSQSNVVYKSTLEDINHPNHQTNIHIDTVDAATTRNTQK